MVTLVLGKKFDCDLRRSFDEAETRASGPLHCVDTTCGSVADLCYFICFIFGQNFSFNFDKSFGNPAFI